MYSIEKCLNNLYSTVEWIQRKIEKRTLLPNDAFTLVLTLNVLFAALPDQRLVHPPLHLLDGLWGDDHAVSADYWLAQDCHRPWADVRGLHSLDGWSTNLEKNWKYLKLLFEIVIFDHLQLRAIFFTRFFHQTTNCLGFLTTHNTLNHLKWINSWNPQKTN